jgi:hypothetical protein
VPWSLLGEENLTREWRTFDLPAIGSETYRISQIEVGDSVGYFLIRPFYLASDAAGPSRRIYKSTTARIITWRFPLELIATELNVRYFQVLMPPRGRIYTGQNWRIRLEELN